MAVRNVRPRGDNPTVSLFPFLAVLLCTMGMLVMLLVLISKGASHSRSNPEAESIDVAVADWDRDASENEEDKDLTLPAVSKDDGSKNAEPVRMTLDEARSQLENATWFRNELLAVREKTDESLQTQRDRLARAEDAVTALVRELDQLKGDLKLLASSTPETTAELDSQIANEKSKFENLSAEVLRLKTENKSTQNRYAIVPYHGKNGTLRQPIYIECTANGVFLMPEGIPFDYSDFLLAKYPGNPFDTAIRTARTVTMKRNSSSPDKDLEPYPLLIVRPGGTDKYYAVVQALASWGGEYGYEFVEENWVLDYPPPDQDLKRQVEEQVALARYRLAVPLATMTAELDRASRQKSLASTRDRQASFGAANGALASQLGGNVRLAAAGESSVLPEYTGQFRDKGVGLTSGSLSADTDTSGTKLATGTATMPLPNQDTLALYSQKLSTSNAIAQEFSSSAPGLQNGNNLTPVGSLNASQAFAPGSQNNQELQKMQSDQMGQSTFISADGSPALTPAATEQGTDQTENSFATGAVVSSQSTENATLSDPRDQLVARVQDNTAPAPANASSPNMPKNRWETVGNTTYAPQSHSAGTPDGAAVPTDSQVAVQAANVSTPQKKKEKADSQKVSYDHDDGDAIHIAETLTRPVNSLVERPIRVVCMTDRIVFPKQPGLRQEQTVLLKENAEKEVLDTIALCVKSWGVAGRNMYWTPWLSVSVPDEKAKPQFMALKSFIEPQGVAVRGSFEQSLK
ncbi:MAG: hypothetical protein Q4G68_00950 [Planctomycetia bacterium]|nr:hypothetical protein [Planctomycetia bacterium]